VTPDIPSFEHVLAASRRIAGHVVRTPIVRSSALDELVGSEVWLKCESLQESGSFKFRGATNAVLQLTDDRAQAGVAAHSSGNHAAALALAARRRGIPATVVMPDNAPAVKRDAVERAGGRIVLCSPTLADRETALRAVLHETGATEIHPYDDPRVIAGAGTAALELIDDVPDLDLVIAPVSGGGLLSGTSIATHGRRPDIEVWGAEPVQVDDAHRSLVTGIRQGDTGRGSVADGLLAVLSERTFAVLRDHVTEVVVVDEAQIVNATILAFERVKLVIEPSAATAVAALLARRGELPPRIGVILSGGNVERSFLGSGNAPTRA
jgi:threonine dehydratase/serine racemase